MDIHYQKDYEMSDLIDAHFFGFLTLMVGAAFLLSLLTTHWSVWTILLMVSAGGCLMFTLWCACRHLFSNAP
jgi:hypothetical protein